MSRRTADEVIANKRVLVNGIVPSSGYDVQPEDAVTLDTKPLKVQTVTTVMLNKPVGYVVSRDGQGSKTIYELLPKELQYLKSVGRLDKDSSGLLLLTNDGELANKLTHPRYQKEKVYEVELDKPLSNEHKKQIEQGVALEDGPSKLKLNGSGKNWTVTMAEGRNRQIRRTFEAVGYMVVSLDRRKFGEYQLEKMSQPGDLKTLPQYPAH